MEVCRLTGVRFTYPGGARPALDGVDLALEEGEFVTLPNLQVKVLQNRLPVKRYRNVLQGNDLILSHRLPFSPPAKFAPRATKNQFL